MVHPSVSEVAPERFSEVAARVASIEESARALDGHPALGDAVWRDLERPSADSAGFVADDLAYAHVARDHTTSPGHWALGIAIAPPARGSGTRRALVDAAVRHVGAYGGGRIVLWLLGAHAHDDTELAAAGLRPVRDQFQMRVSLPLDRRPKWPEGIRVRPFERGLDDEAWVEVNNRAFADHAEQGGWTTSTLARRLEEPWFDPKLFLLAFDADGLAGFNWMKVHEAHEPDPRLGEIYVVGVDPRAEGTGLGTALAVAGLDAVHALGIDTGMLFCAADNSRALRLYESLGFVVHRVDRAYEREVAPA